MNFIHRSVVFIVALIIGIVLTLYACSAKAQQVNWVNDHAQVLTVEQRSALSNRLAALERMPQAPQVVIALPISLDGKSVEQWANETFRAWGIGQAALSNGVLIVIATKERKIRIEVGYGLEGVIPDTRAKQIIDREMVPHMKAGKVYAALDAAIDGLAADLSREQKTQSTPIPTEKTASSWPAIVWLFIVIGSILFIMVVLFWRRKERIDHDEVLISGLGPTYRPPLRSDSWPGSAAAIGAGAGMGAAMTSPSKPKPKPSSSSSTRRSSSSGSGGYSGGSYSGGGYSGGSSSSGDSGGGFSGGGGDSGGGGASSGY